MVLQVMSAQRFTQSLDQSQFSARFRFGGAVIFFVSPPTENTR